MSPSLVRGLLNLQRLVIGKCNSMKEVITEEGEEIMTNEPLFPRLEKLKLEGLADLGHFFLTKHTLEFLFLRKVKIYFCFEMKTFVQHEISVNTPNLKRIQQPWFNSKVSCPNLKDLHIGYDDNISVLFSHQLPTAYFSKLEILKVFYCPKLRNLMSSSLARGLLNLQLLYIEDCESMEEVITEEGEDIMTNEPLFPLLEQLKLRNLPKLAHFFLTKHALEFPYPERNTFIQQEISMSTLSLESVDSDDEMKAIDHNKAMFNSMVSCPNLKQLHLYRVVSINVLCSHRLPTGYFSKLEKLNVCNCSKLRNMMSPSVARGLLNLRTLVIAWCLSMEEVITKEGEEINEPFFPLLEELELNGLHKLGHFFLMECALEFPLLWSVVIEGCPKMKTFVQQGISVSTPSLKCVNYDKRVDDLNKWIQQQWFNSKKEDAGDGRS